MCKRLQTVTMTTVPRRANRTLEYVFEAVADTAFTEARIDRNRGFLTESQIRMIQKKKVVIGGSGGIGGHIDESMLRLCVKEIGIADSGFFDQSNIHRQFGATMKTIGKSKMLETIRLLRQIATDVKLRGYSGINKTTVRPFLRGAHIANDAIEYHAIGARYLLNKTAKEMGVPVFNGNSVGFGTNIFLFEPGGPTLIDIFPFGEDYAYYLENRFAQGTITEEEYQFLCKTINAVFLSDIPDYGDSRYNTREAFLDRLLMERTASIVSTNPKMASGVLADRILLYLVDELGIYEQIQKMPAFPEFLYFDAATWTCEKRSLNIKKIRYELDQSMPR
jgi:molybdopterin/thiamine biosynthesis adenylyltransferase